MNNYILNEEKYKATILYLVNSLGEIEGKKKAYKLMYYLDFDFFEAYEKPFTGETYKALPMGPAPIYFTAIVEELVKEKKLKVSKVNMAAHHEYPATIYKAMGTSDYKFTEEEKKMLDRIIKKYGNLTGTDLEKLTHAEAPYNAVNAYQVIPYEYSFYRDTQNLV